MDYGKGNVEPAVDTMMFAEIRRKATAALEEAEKSRATHWAVNWADLRVIDVIHCQSEDGLRWYMVEIEEANSPELEAFVAKRLVGLGVKIQVRTSW